MGEKSAAAARSYLVEHRVRLPFAIAPAHVLRVFGNLHDVPVTFFVDGEGRIRRRFDGERDYNTLAQSLRSILKPAAPSAR